MITDQDEGMLPGSDGMKDLTDIIQKLD